VVNAKKQREMEALIKKQEVLEKLIKQKMHKVNHTQQKKRQFA